MLIISPLNPEKVDGDRADASLTGYDRFSVLAETSINSLF